VRPGAHRFFRHNRAVPAIASCSCGRIRGKGRTVGCPSLRFPPLGRFRICPSCGVGNINSMLCLAWEKAPVQSSLPTAKNGIYAEPCHAMRGGLKVSSRGPGRPPSPCPGGDGARDCRA
jgi:hypothetical protein